MNVKLNKLNFVKVVIFGLLIHFYLFAKYPRPRDRDYY